jgi:hypothetical protein
MVDANSIRQQSWGVMLAIWGLGIGISGFDQAVMGATTGQRAASTLDFVMLAAGA